MAEQLLRCDRCKKTFRAPSYDPRQTYTCRECGVALEPASRVPEGEQSPGGPAEENDPMVGRELGPYRIVEKLGEGGMGAVYKAEHMRLRKLRALKILPRHVVERSPKAAQRFTREAQSAAALEHPNIVAVHNVDEIDGVHFIDMDFIEGESLHARVAREGRLRVEEATRIVLAAAEALAAAHAKSIVHRDIKPANILLDAEGEVKVTDFGLAKDVAHDTLLTEAGRGGLGTPHFMSPEQAEDAQVDARSDIYSLGCTYYCLLTGQLPFKGNTPVSIALAHREHPVPDPRGIATDLPESVCEIVMKAMAKKPKDRYQTCEELIAALSAIRVGKQVASPAAPPEARADSSPLGLRPLRPRIAVGLIAAVVAALVCVLVIQTRRDSGGQAEVPVPRVAEQASGSSPESGAGSVKQATIPDGFWYGYVHDGKVEGFNATASYTNAAFVYRGEPTQAVFDAAKAAGIKKLIVSFEQSGWATTINANTDMVLAVRLAGFNEKIKPLKAKCIAAMKQLPGIMQLLLIDVKELEDPAERAKADAALPKLVMAQAEIPAEIRLAVGVRVSPMRGSLAERTQFLRWAAQAAKKLAAGRPVLLLPQSPSDGYIRRVPELRFEENRAAYQIAKEEKLAGLIWWSYCDIARRGRTEFWGVRNCQDLLKLHSELPK